MTSDHQDVSQWTPEFTVQSSDIKPKCQLQNKKKNHNGLW